MRNKGPKESSVLKAMKLLAKGKGGQCLSKQYDQNNPQLQWQCSTGHLFSATPDNVKMGKWCPTCNKKNKRNGSNHAQHPSWRGNEMLDTWIIDL